MALSFEQCCCGFSGLGATARPRLPSPGQVAREELLRRAGLPPNFSPAQAAKGVATNIAKQAGLPSIPTSPKQVGRQAAEYVVEQLDIPVPRKFSPDELLSLAKLAPVQLPFPLPVPLPTNVRDAVELGLRTAVQVVGPEVLAAVGLGSVVPGVGNAVGAAVALATVMVSMLQSEDPEAIYTCRVHNQEFYKMGNVNTHHATPLLMLAAKQLALAEAKKIRATPGARRPVRYDRQGRPTKSLEYNKTSVRQCITDLELLIRDRLGPMVKGSVRSTSLPMAMHALRVLEMAQALGQGLEPAAQRTMSELRQRIETLQKLLKDYNALVSLPMPPASDRKAVGDRLTSLINVKKRLLDEVRRAAAAAQLSQNTMWQKPNVAQFAIATSMWNHLNEIQNELTKAFGAPPARTAEAHRKEVQAFQRSERQSANGAAPSPQAARDYCARIFDAWRKDPKNAAQARCLGPTDIDQISKICFQAHGTRAISPATALQMIGRQIQAACARQARSGSAALRGLADVRPTVLIEEHGRLVPKPVRPYSQPAVALREGTRAAEIARSMG